ncbi:hypothetical protein [Nocardia grenadensis]|uniref:hypothetical protein n=1 Tax=Nocardia grenadensis TaxID=931537 RepID=UPI000A52C446|nr:hypothetical protein [Nocardia grenadensis]
MIRNDAQNHESAVSLSRLVPAFFRRTAVLRHLLDRFSGTALPTLGGLFIGTGLAPVTIFVLTIIPTLIAAVAIMQLARVVAARTPTKQAGTSDSTDILETT